MAPPSYAELGKLAKDLFAKGYNFGLFKLDCSTKTSSGIELNTSGVSNQTSGKISGSLETKYKFSDYGLTLTEKWNTENLFSSEASMADNFAEGLKLSLLGTFAPQSGNKTGKIKVGYGQDNFKVDSDINIDLSGPLINFSGVFGYEGWLAGYQTGIDTQQSQITTNNFAVGYTTDETVVHAALNNIEVLDLSVFQKFADNLHSALKFSWTSGSNDISVDVGVKYRLENEATIRAKINDKINIGLGYQQKIYDGVSLALCASIDGKNITEGSHKLGVALSLSA